jgi:hypothetical protein
MRKKGENNIKPPPGKAAIRSNEIMISPLVSKVARWDGLADFAALRGCSAVEGAPAARHG